MLKNNLLIVFAEKKTKASKVSKETGIAESTISNLANNKTDVKLSTLIKLCNALKVRLSDLIEFLPE
ncbi:helix-turn-helix domain-containing protein [Streptococcus pyogenes]|uniref:helix-turn-helix domain-containing protein n=1 Tax=Streptococcus pyogenes TaxID=1314 RepID=UPI0010A16C1A|nr:helix-turn-helix transcriptional regulator [Streptococcus pyogenes]VHA78478.1 Cro/CI family transcriptional regulator [Streptococcus pyogenes]VHB70489.1 Cro/CI family transcriptional regulator [Streptococcus pyogenes]VHD12813.1 Cro/CI family transcriptional regulator [Streptococcus pyogenes]